MSNTAGQFQQLVQHPLKFRLFLLQQLPSAFFTGVRVEYMDNRRCTVRVPYKWLTRNPFRSTYFACLSMAAEMSTGALALSHVYKRRPAVSMLVVKLEGEFYKKATGKTVFTCRDGEALEATVEKAIATGEAQVFTATSVGSNDEGEPVAEFRVTWSFKSRKTATT